MTRDPPPYEPDGPRLSDGKCKGQKTKYSVQASEAVTKEHDTYIPNPPSTIPIHH